MLSESEASNNVLHWVGYWTAIILSNLWFCQMRSSADFTIRSTWSWIGRK